MKQLSDLTIAEQLTRRLRGGRVFQMFVRKLGPNDVVYASAWAWGHDGNMVEIKATADTLEHALTQLFRNIDQATEPNEEP